jgi:hypothetical protein
VHKHICEILPDVEIVAFEEIQGEERLQVDAATTKHPCCEKYQHVDNQQMFYNGGEKPEALW